MCNENVKQRTNLDLGDNWQEYIRSPTLGSPRSNKQQRGDSIQGGRLHKHSHDGLIQSAHPSRRAQGIPNILAVQDESGSNNDGEEDVECNGD